MEYILSDIIELIGGGTPKTSVPEYWDGDIPWLSVKDFSGENRYVYETEKCITEEGLNNSSTKYLNQDDIIVSARGTVGEMAMIPFSMTFNQSCYGIRAKRQLVDPFYLYYLMKYNLGELKSKVHGSVFDTITKDTFKQITVNLPNLEVQKKVADILGNLDDKIENNDKINRNLEDQANALFKAYFIDQIMVEYLEYKDTEYGRIPSSWTFMDLGDVGLDISDGNYSSKYPKTDEFLSEGVPFIRGTDFNGTSINQSNMMYISPEKHAELKKGHTKKGDILITTRGDIGRIAFVPDSLIDVNINSQLVRINGGDIVPRAFLACFLTSSKVQNDFKSLITGSALQQLPVGKLKKVMFLLPDKAILKTFEDNVEPLFHQIFAKAEECIKLAKIRDSLLPKLMSGELDVSDLNI